MIELFMALEKKVGGKGNKRKERSRGQDKKSTGAFLGVQGTGALEHRNVAYLWVCVYEAE